MLSINCIFFFTLQNYKISHLWHYIYVTELFHNDSNRFKNASDGYIFVTSAFHIGKAEAKSAKML